MERGKGCYRTHQNLSIAHFGAQSSGVRIAESHLSQSVTPFLPMGRFHRPWVIQLNIRHAGGIQAQG